MCNDVRIEDNKNVFDFFINRFKDLDHSNNGYINHCLGVFNILKTIGADTSVCLAGLYHSAYGTDSYNPNINISRNELKELIGEYSESLVYEFCSISNKEVEILNRNLNSQKDEDLLIMSYANIKEQQHRANDPELDNLIMSYESKIFTNQANNNVEEIIIDGKKIIIFDSLFEKYHLDALNSLCINSQYRGDHGSSPLSAEMDFRFVSYLNKEQLVSVDILNPLTKIKEYLATDIFLGHSYINHYWHHTASPSHTDSSFDNTITILIFCNTVWHEHWGGEIKFYDSAKKVNPTIDFKPGRVIVFDSRLEHKVLPITLESKKPRFSLAMKASTGQGLDSLIKMYGQDNIIKL